MRYLRQFNESKKRETISNDIEEILLPIKDLGLRINYQIQDIYIVVYISTKIHTDAGKYEFSLHEIRDEVNH